MPYRPNMKCRKVSFFLDPGQVAASIDSISREVLPDFLALPDFRGYLALQSDHGARTELIVMSFWDEGLDGSEAASTAFTTAVYNAAGTNPTRSTFDVLGALIVDESGAVPMLVP